VEALRTAGYLPVVEDGDGNVVVVGGARPLRAADGGVPATRGRPPAQRGGPGGAKRPAAPNVAALAAALVRAGDPGERPPASRSEALVRQLAPDLPDAQARLLGHAVDTGTDVVIEYVSASGAHTRRRVSDLGLTGGTLQAWCHLRQDERFFTLSRIASVRPVASGA